MTSQVAPTLKRKLLQYRKYFLCAFLLSFSGALMAASAPKVMKESHQLFSNENHFYASAGAKVYFFDWPKMSPSWSVSPTSSKSIASDRFNTTRVGGALSLGYEFNNMGFWPKVFGQQNDIQIDGFYLNGTSREHNPYIGNNSAIWFINGSGIAVQPFPGVTSYQFLNIKNQIKIYEINPRIIGHNQLSDRWTMSPSLGVIYTRVENNIDAKIKYRQSATEFAYDIENFDTTVNYYGVTAGDRFTLHFKAPYFQPYIGAQLQLLAAQANLSAYQDRMRPASGQAAAGSTVRVSNSVSTLTYRVKAEVGLNLKFTQNLLSPYINVAAGWDYWGGTPQVETPRSASGKAAHVELVSTLNPYAGLNVVVPFA